MSVPTSLSWWPWKCSEQMPTRMPGLWSAFWIFLYIFHLQDQEQSWKPVSNFFLVRWEGLWAALPFALVLSFSDRPAVLICLFYLWQTQMSAFHWISYMLTSKFPLYRAVLPNTHNSPNMCSFDHDTQTYSWMSLPPPGWLPCSHTTFLLSLLCSPLFASLFTFLFLFFFLFCSYAPFPQCPATPKMRSYLYLAKYPCTSKQKVPTVF